MVKHITIRLDLDEILRSIPKDQTAPVLLLTQPKVADSVGLATAYLDGKCVSYNLRGHGTISTLLGADDVYFLAAQDYIYGIIPDRERMRSLV